MISRIDVECRAEQRPGNKIGGYASVFGVRADLGPKGKEEIAPGAFDDALKDSDVRALWNHDVAQLLGRQSAGTLRLSLDSAGLEYEIDLPDTTYARDLRELIDRGDVDGASFGFVSGLSRLSDDRLARVHTRIATLVDVSPVTFPAYSGSTAEARTQEFGGVDRRSQLIRARARIRRGL